MPLLYVLWTVALLTTIATAISASGLVSYRIVHNVSEAIRHEAIAEAALNRAVLALLDQRPEKRWRPNATPQRFTFEGVEIAVSIQDELGRIDLNHADTLLGNLFRWAGAAAEDADRLVDRVIDWRDADDLKRLNGAEAAEYRAAGFPDRPRNAPFASVQELQLIVAITPALFRKVEPLLTVHSGRAMIDLQLAPSDVRAALGGSLSTAPGGDQTPMPNQFARTEGRAFSVHIEFSSHGVQISRDAAIRLTGNPSEPYWLLGWRAEDK